MKLKIEEGQRKTVAYFFSSIVLVFFCIFGLIEGDEFVNGFVWLTGIFMGANIGEHISRSKSPFVSIGSRPVRVNSKDKVIW